MLELPNLKSFDKEEFKQLNVVSLFTLVGMAITAIMGLIGLFNGNFILASTLFFASFIYFLGYYAYQKFNNIEFSSAIVLYSLYLLMFYLTYTGGVENTGPLWIFIVAPVSVFIHGLKRGLINIALFVTIISTIMFMPTEIIAHAEYSIEFKLRLLYSFLTVTFLSALYEYSREKSYKHALELSKKYQQLAHFDPLTQLSNRRGALSLLTQEKSRISRNQQPFSIILCDVDHFKKVNDQYGHNAGDAVLVELAKVFTKYTRDQDCIARWGGEEFIFILPQTLAENANIFAEKIQERLQEHVVNYKDEKIKVTVSMGIEQFNENQSIDEVINNADKYLYQAKNAGRNQIFPKF
ncbi:GGDEF domain-containing protein [Colwellia sp. 12G3]|uniref:GGDEF domain-containing protein n=1 Tax=Colwellia sp. 12G3 TaxID=2058299 RepID=UPI001E5DE72D|nr:GGDEF domain-containing protein [Colwellia sp. 12G3]